MSETRELYEIKHEIERITPILDRIAVALEKLAPQGSEREQIALRLFIHAPNVEAEASFYHADAWIEERDRQRAQAEHGRAE